MTTVCDSTLVGDVVAGSAAGVRGRLWQLRPAEVRDVAVSASAEILRLEAIRVAAVDALALNPDEQVL
ncbi:HNH endonuclease, partial [Rhodococcus globerulus]|nr:HNH endonuclease [Rhodococcus globerulus]